MPGVAELAEEGQDLVLTLERELDELAIGDLDDLVRAGGLGLTLDDLLEGLLLEGLLGRRARFRRTIAPCAS